MAMSAAASGTVGIAGPNIHYPYNYQFMQPSFMPTGQSSSLLQN